MFNYFSSWSATVKALVSPTPELAEYCYKFAEFL